MDRSIRPCDSHTLRNVRQDFPEWHLGRQHYALWALAVDTPAVCQRLQAAQTHLQPWLLEGYRRQAHITLALCGFPSEMPVHGDDFGPAALQQQVQALRQCAPQPFGLRIGGLDSFASVPYLTVQADAGALDSLRLCLAHGALNAAPAQYVPHVTVGLYADAWPMATLQTQFQRFAAPEALALHIDRISLMRYVSREIGGPLQTLAHYSLESQRLVWTGASAADAFGTPA